MLEDLARCVDKEEGLKKLKINFFLDQNTLEEWPLSQLLFKSHRLKKLTIWDLRYTTATNRSQILEFAGLAATTSRCLSTLTI